MTLSPFILLVFAIGGVILSLYTIPLIISLLIAWKWRGKVWAWLPLLTVLGVYTYLYIQDNHDIKSRNTWCQTSSVTTTCSDE